MAAVEALHLDVAYIAVAKALGLPCQSYMALSDAKILDAQAGAETFASALLAALAGVNSVSGPGMLDFLLVFSLPKLIFDDELAGQALHFLREIRVLDDLPTRAPGRSADGRSAPHHGRPHDGQLADRAVPHRADHRPREPRELAAGRRQGHLRPCLRRGRAPAGGLPARETDPLVDAELQAIIRSGLVDQDELPVLPAAIAPTTSLDDGPARRRNPRRERAG